MTGFWKKSALLATLLWAMAASSDFAMAQPVDPKLAASWAFVQKAMPGVSYNLLKAACDERTIMIYHGTWVDAQDEQIAGFRKRFPCVNVQKFGATIGDMRERFLSELRAGRPVADIYQDSDPGTLNTMSANGTLMNYKISNDGAFTPATKKSGFWYPLRAALVGIAWNTDLVTPAEAKLLMEWKGITNPIWKGRAVAVDPASGGVAYLPWYAWTRLYGEGFIDQIAALKPRIVSGINTASSALASGDVAVIINASETGLLPLWLKGAPIRWSLPAPGVGPLTGQAIAANSPHPNAAKLYHEYSFTEEGYGLWQKLGGASVRIGHKDLRKVAAEPWYKAPTDFFDYDPAVATEATPKIIAKFKQAVGAGK